MPFRPPLGAGSLARFSGRLDQNRHRSSTEVLGDGCPLSFEVSQQASSPGWPEADICNCLIESAAARVWSSLGGETKKVSGGWEIDVTNDSKPADGKLTVFAQVASAFLYGREIVGLSGDHSVALTLALHQDNTAKITGTVFDALGRKAKNAIVYVTGYPFEAAKTNDTGYFELKAHKSEGQQVELHAEANGETVDVYRPAGHDPVELWLGKH